MPAALNQAIRARRVASGLVDDTATVTGGDGQPIGKGDAIQTRRNDNTLGVANRQTWTVVHIQDGTVWARPTDASRATARMVRLPAEYVHQWAHLSYAATAYGVQGVTAPGSHTILTEATSAAGLYVGMTRGRQANLLHIVADDMAEARQQYIDTMSRDRADRGLTYAARVAREAVTGLVDDSSARLVNAEKARLREQVVRAQQQADCWQQWADEHRRQTEDHHAAWDAAQQAAEDAAAVLARAREQAAEPLTAQAIADARRAATARQTAAQARERAATAGVLTRRVARSDTVRAEQAAAILEADLTARWGSAPGRWANPDAWAARTAMRRAETAPAVVTAIHAAQAAQDDLKGLLHRQKAERDILTRRMYGTSTAPLGSQLPCRQAEHYRRLAGHDAAKLARIEALPLAEAAAHIHHQQVNTDGHEAGMQAKTRVEPTPDHHCTPLGGDNQRRLSL